MIYVRSYISATIDASLTSGGFHEALLLRICTMKGAKWCVVFTEVSLIIMIIIIIKSNYHPMMTTLLTC